MKNNQKGIAHIQLIAALVAVTVVVGFAAYRVGQNNSSNQANQETDSEIELAENIKVNEEESKEIDIPKQESEAKTEPEPVKQTQPVEKTTQKTEEVKKDKVYLSMKSVSAVQSGSVVNVSSKIQSTVTGTCNFKLYKEGFEKVYSSNKITNSQDCVGQLNVSGMPNYEGWSLHVWFDGDDGKTYAYQDNIDNFPLVNPN